MQLTVNKGRFILVVSLLAVVLVVLFIALGWRPAEKEKTVFREKVPTLFSGQKAPPLNFVGGAVSFPSEMETYSMADRPLSETEAISAAASFGFSNSPREIEDKVDGKILFWDLPTETLQIRLKQKVLKYAVKNFSVEKRNPPTLSEAQGLAREFLESRGLFSNLSFKGQLEYLKGLATSARIVRLDESEGVKVSLTYKLSGLPLFDEFLGPDPVSAVLGNEGRVVSLSYLFFREADLKSEGKVAILSLSEARELLSNGEGVAAGALSADPERAGPVKADSPLGSVFLSYFHSVKTSTVQPVFVFEGLSTRAILPAAKKP